MNRSIIHINITSFYASVAQAADTRLRGRPLVVATSGATRRMVLDASLPAHDAGIRRGMLLDVAGRLCRDLTVIDPAPDLYDRAFAVVLKEADRLSPLVEPAGPGHVFIDLTGTDRLLGSPMDNAAKLRTRIWDTYRMDPVIGIATNKLISKVATRVIKPTGLCRIEAGFEEEFLGPLPVQMLPVSDHVMISQLRQFNILHINELSHIPERSLAQVFGSAATMILQSARGIDNTPVRRRGEVLPSIKETHVFAGQTNEAVLIEKELLRVVSRGGVQLRSMGMVPRTIRLTITYSDALQAKEQIRPRTPVNGELSLYRICRALLEKGWVRRVRLRSITLEFRDLAYPCTQLDLFENNENEEHLMGAMDRIRDHFGVDSIQFAVGIKGP